MASNTKQAFLNKTDNIEMGIFSTEMITEVCPLDHLIRIGQGTRQNKSVHSWAQCQTLWRLWASVNAPLGILRHILILKLEYHYSKV